MVEHELQAAQELRLAAIGERIEYAHLDVRVRGQQPDAAVAG